MKKFIVKIVSILLIFFIFVACEMEPAVQKNGNNNNNQVEVSNNYTGTISGKVVYSNGSGIDNSGIIVTLETSDGMRTATVACALQNRSVSNSSRSIVDSVVTDYMGSYSFSNLEPGLYTIYASSNCSAERAVYTNVYVNAKEEATVKDLTLTAIGSIKGKIMIDNNSSGNTGFLVFVAGTSYMAMTADDGSYVITGSPAGDNYQIVATIYGVTYNVDSSVTVPANSCKTIYTKTVSLIELAAAVKGKDGASIVWLGSYANASSINNPKYLNAYYNTTDGCSYIYNGDEWELLASKGGAGNDGTSINWRGSYTSSGEISDPEYSDVYYNTSDGCSYFYNGNSWSLLAKAGADGEDGEDGKNGISINWRGDYSYSNDVSDPKYLDAYYNTTLGCSYIYLGVLGWHLLAKKGDQGDPGDSGENGASITWRGSYASSSEISDPETLDAYYNTTDGCSYLYNGRTWTLLAKAGTDGEDGENGEDGASIRWRGSFSDSSKISSPQALDAYFNTTDGCSYIYDGVSWILMARKGSDGATSSSESGITWLGSYSRSTEIRNPKPLDAYYNTTDGCSYIYNGTEWQIFAKAGLNGSPINWLGSYINSKQISNPKKLDAYFNTTENCAYIYNGYNWTLLINGPASGATGSGSFDIGSTTGANVSGSTLLSWDNPEGVIRIPNGVTDISSSVFYNKDKITKVIIPSSVVSIGEKAFYDCNGLTSVEFLGPGLQIIGAESFRYCNNMSSVVFSGNTLQSIGEGAFRDCSKFTNITLPTSLQTIGTRAFQNCTSLTTIIIPNSVISVGNEVFFGCRLLRSVSIGSGLTGLSGKLFCDCDALVSFTIPDTVTWIAETVFYACDSLVSLSVTGNWKYGSANTSKELTISGLKNSFYGNDWTRVTD